MEVVFLIYFIVSIILFAVMFVDGIRRDKDFEHYKNTMDKVREDLTQSWKHQQVEDTIMACEQLEQLLTEQGFTDDYVNMMVNEFKQRLEN